MENIADAWIRAIKLGKEETVEKDLQYNKSMQNATKTKNEFDKLVDNLREVMEANGYRADTKMGRTCEYSFLQGAISAKPELLDSCPLIGICMMSGRSVLSI